MGAFFAMIPEQFFPMIPEDKWQDFPTHDTTTVASVHCNAVVLQLICLNLRGLVEFGHHFLEEDQWINPGCLLPSSST